MKEFREEKEKLEAKIKESINDFEEKYNCYIANVNLIHTGGRTKMLILNCVMIRGNL